VHTVIVVAIGLLLLGACVLSGQALAGPAAAARAALWFLPLWLLGAAINMYIGVRSAGYAVSEELPVLLLVFAVPAVAALIAWWRLRN
jgi:hypothetical protein